MHIPRPTPVPIPQAARPLSRAFTLVEIMVVIVLIGLLATLALPALQRAQTNSHATRLANDFRQFEAAFSRYSLESGQWPPPCAPGTMPAGMTDYLPAAFTNPSPHGGNFLWSGPSHSIVLQGSTASDTLMRHVDAILDDGNLSTGNFQKNEGVGFHLQVP